MSMSVVELKLYAKAYLIMSNTLLLEIFRSNNNNKSFIKASWLTYYTKMQIPE